MTSFLYTADAILDVREAYAWYERNRPGLGDEFLSALGEAERAIQESPAAFRIIHRDARRYLLRRFPYQLIYRIADDVIVVVACFHVRRDPGRVRHRT